MNRSPRSRTIAAGLGGLALAVLMACSPVVPPLPEVGAVSVSVVGLPPEVAAQLQLVSPTGAPLDLTGNAVLDDVEVGAYELVVEEVCRQNVLVCPDVDAFLPEVERIPFEVAPGRTSSVEVVYHCALLEPPDPVLAALLLEAVQAQTGDPAAPLSCALLANVTELAWLNPGNPPIVDLEGLQYARRLESLAVQPQEVTDLTPLAGLGALRHLRLGMGYPYDWDLAADLDPILNLPRLEELYVPRGSFTEIPDLSGLPALRRLAIEGSLLTDLSGLAGAPLLESFDARGCTVPFGDVRGGVVDLAPLADLVQLRQLFLYCHRIGDLTPLAGLTSLESLDLGLNEIADLAPLAALSALTDLNVERNDVASLDVVRDFPALERLKAGWTLVEDVRPVHLLAVEHGVLQRVDLLESCVASTEVPSAWYVADLQARGIVVYARDRSSGACAGVPNALATFELDDEGWTTSGDAGNLRRVASGGPNGGGYLEADDLQDGVTWFWEAPPKFDGDASAFLGGGLEVTLKQSAVDSQFASANDVILAGAGMVLTYDVSELVGTAWTGLLVPLSTLTDSGWQSGGNPADETMMAAVLADLTRIAIRGEYRTGADTGGIGYFGLFADGK